MIAKDRAAWRFLQIAELEESVRRIEAAIPKVERELQEVRERLSALRREKNEALDTIRQAARDEGQMPLDFDIDHALSVARVGAPVEP